MLACTGAGASHSRDVLFRLAARLFAAAMLLASFPAVAADLTIGQYVVVSKTRVGNDLYDFVIQASVTNTGPGAINVVATASSTFSKVQILDGSLSFGIVASGQTVQSSDTFTVRTKKNFDKRLIHPDEDQDSDDDDYHEGPFAVLSWAFTYDVDTTPPAISGETPKDVAVATAAPVVGAQYQDSGAGINVAKVILKLDGTDVSGQASISATGISYTASALAEGAHAVSLSVADNLGNVATDNWNFTVDTVPPVISGESPKGIVSTSTTPTLTAQYQDTGSGIDVTKIVLTLDGANVTSGATVTAAGISYTPGSALSQGAHNAVLMVADKAGNTVQSQWSFTVDTLPPAISGQSPADGTFALTATPVIAAQYQDASGIDTTRVALTIDGTDVTASATVSATGVSYTPASALAGGKHTVVLRVADIAGNSVQASWSFSVDAAPPAISAQTPKDITVPTATPTVSAQYQDVDSGIDTAKVVLTLDGADVTATATVTATGISYTPATALPGGVHNVTLTVSDKAGNQAQSSWSFTVDMTPPVISLQTPKDVTVPTVTPTISAQYLDAESGIDTTKVKLTLDGIDVTASATVSETGISYTPTTALTGGTHNVVLAVADKVGNPAQSSWSFSVDMTPPVISNLLPLNNSFIASGAPTISAQLQDAESGIDPARVQLLVDGSDVTASSTISQSAISYISSGLAQGVHQVALKVYDRAGNSADAAWQFAVDAVPPSVSGETPKDVELLDGNNVSISAKFSDDLSGVDTVAAVMMFDGIEVTQQAVIDSNGIAFSPSSLSEGKHDVYIRIPDRAGSVAESYWSFTVTVQTSYSLTLNEPSDGTTVTNGVIQVRGIAGSNKTLVKSVSVNGIGADLTVNADATVTYTSKLLRLIEGNNAINIVAQYEDGQSRTLTVAINYDGPPVISISSPQDLATLGPVSVTSPRNLTGMVERPVTVSGSVSKDVVSVSVNQQEATLSGRNFTFNNFFLHEGVNLVTVVATDATGRTGSSSITVTVDQTAPILAIEQPTEKYITSQSRIDVRGLVNDAVEGLVGDSEPKVTVNGVQAKVGDRYFIASGVPLQVGDNKITVTATDHVGNVRTSTVSVTRIQAGASRLSVISGNNQTGPINAELPNPLVVVALDAQGQALANHEITFDILRGTGGVSASQGGTPVRNLKATTDASGQASVYFTTGKQNGFANNVVRVSAIDIPEMTLFTATGQAAAAARINADMMGVNQYAEAGNKVLEPMVAIVTDAADNKVAGVSVTFKVEEGDASFDGQPQVVLTTDKNGIASARPTMGLTPGRARITATVEQVGSTTFSVISLASSNQSTRFSGIVMNDRQQPLPGVQMSIGRTALTVTTDSQGKFNFDGSVPPGKIDLFVDGRTSTVQGEVYPALHFEALAVRGQDNKLAQPIYLPAINTPETKIVGGDQDVELHIPGATGFAMKVFAHSVTFPDGTKTGPLVVSRVNQDKLPMVPPGGASFFMAPAWTIQPSGTRFDPPIQISIPNSQSLKPGESRNIYQWDHDLATFVPIGRATVNEDASYLVTETGSGVTKAGWGGGTPTPPPSTCDQKGPPDCSKNCQKTVTDSSGCQSCTDDSANRQLSITKPSENQDLRITGVPAMPSINATASLTPSSDVEYQWRMIVVGSYVGLTCGVNCENTSRSNTWEPNISSCSKIGSGVSTIVGGDADLTVNACNGKSDRKTFKILGDNPDKSLIQAALPSDRLRQIACVESGQRQFWNNGNPKTSTYAVGVMQVVTGKNCSHVWNWQDNIAKGLDIWADKVARAAAHHTYEYQFNTSLANCRTNNNVNFVPPALTADEQLREATRRYNGGREYIWSIDNPLTCEGHWTVGPNISMCAGYCDGLYVSKVLNASPSCP